MRLRLLIPMFGLGVGFLGLWAYYKFEDRRLRQELSQAQRDFVARRFGGADPPRGARLAARWPGAGEVEYWLGSCEMIRGHDAAALAAWARVPEESREGPMAALSCGRLGLETGRYQLAEETLTRASREPG